MKTKHIDSARWAAFIIFAAAVFSTRQSGVFLFDNNYIYHNVDSLGVEWCEWIEFVYESGLACMLVVGIYLFLDKFRNGIPRKISLLVMVKIVGVAAVVAVLFSSELQAINRQQRVAEKFATAGDHFDFIHRSFFTYGEWYFKIILFLGIPCSIMGWVCFVSWFLNSVWTRRNLGIAARPTNSDEISLAIHKGNDSET